MSPWRTDPTFEIENGRKVLKAQLGTLRLPHTELGKHLRSSWIDSDLAAILAQAIVNLLESVRLATRDTF